jgi:Predicted permeases
MSAKDRSLMEIHFAVLLFGLSGLFGKLLLLPSIVIVLGRVFFSSIFLLILLLYLKKDIKLKQRKDYFYLIIMGMVLAVHWGTFFRSIQVSTVAVGLLTFSTFPVFVTFLEPLFFKEEIGVSDILIAIITFSGVVLIVPKFELGSSITQGALWGILSGFTYGVLSMLNRKYVREYSSLVISFYEQCTATVLLIPFYYLYKPVFQYRDIVLLILLGVVFTGISHSIFINGLKNIKARTAGIISSLEPVYGIVFSIFLLKEIPTLREVIGGVIILAAAFYSTVKTK